MQMGKSSMSHNGHLRVLLLVLLRCGTMHLGRTEQADLAIVRSIEELAIALASDNQVKHIRIKNHLDVTKLDVSAVEPGGEDIYKFVASSFLKTISVRCRVVACLLMGTRTDLSLR
jgi:hypothetical protein